MGLGLGLGLLLVVDITWLCIWRRHLPNKYEYCCALVLLKRSHITRKKKNVHAHGGWPSENTHLRIVRTRHSDARFSLCAFKFCI